MKDHMATTIVTYRAPLWEMIGLVGFLLMIEVEGFIVYKWWWLFANMTLIPPIIGGIYYGLRNLWRSLLSNVCGGKTKKCFSPHKPATPSGKQAELG